MVIARGMCKLRKPIKTAPRKGITCERESNGLRLAVVSPMARTGDVATRDTCAQGTMMPWYHVGYCLHRQDDDDDDDEDDDDHDDAEEARVKDGRREMGWRGGGGRVRRFLVGEGVWGGKGMSSDRGRWGEASGFWWGAGGWIRGVGIGRGE